MKRSSSDSFVISLKLNMTPNDVCFLEKRFAVANRIHNQLVTYVRKQIQKYRSDARYIVLMTERHTLTNKQHINAVNLKLKDIRMSYGLSEYQLYAYVKLLQHTYKRFVSSQSAQRIASDVWRSVERFLYGDGKSIHYRKINDCSTLHGSNTNASGIIFDGKYSELLAHK